MTADRSTPPSSFGPYEIVASLGRGASGDVYRAWDPRLQREVALKILHDRSAADPARLRRFVSEARAASGLNHPNIVTVFDAAIDGETPFIVTEVIDGRTLRDELAAGPLPLKRLLDLATQIADGLSAAHEAGIAHRDLKPENIMVTRSGRAKIVDFGLAWPGAAAGELPTRETPAAHIALTLTDHGLRAGTIPYMSPEQARGTTSDFRSDQFAFGLILHEMAAGRHAFRRATPAETLHAIINDDLPPLPLDPRRPVLLQWVIERCTAKAPDERYGVTADLYRDLRTLRDRLGEAVAVDATTPARSETSALRSLLTATGLVAAFAAGAGFLWLAIEPPPRAEASSFTPLATGPSLDVFPAWSPATQTIAHAADVQGVLQIFTRGLSAPSAAPLTDTLFDNKEPFWSPDGKRLYYVSRAHEGEGIWSIGATGGRPQLVVRNASHGAISKDGVLAFLRDQARADIVGVTSLYLSRPAGDPPWSPDVVEAAARRYEPLASLRFVEGFLAFSPDGRTLGLNAVGLTLNESPENHGLMFWRIPMTGGPPERRLASWSGIAPIARGFSWLPDNRQIVLGATSIAPMSTHLYVADLDRDRVWPLTHGADSEFSPSVSPHGDQLAFVRGEPDYDLTEYSISERRTTPVLATTRNESEPAWAPDGDSYVYVTDRSGQPEIWLATPKAGLDRPIVSDALFPGDPTIMLGAPVFSPDGQRIAYLRNGSRPIWPLRIWTTFVAGGEPTPLLPRSEEGYHGSPSWSPNGESIAYVDYREAKWQLITVRLGSEVRNVLRSDGVPNANARWSPRDDWITWETPAGLTLVSPDGTREKVFYPGQFLVHAWSKDGREVLGIEDTEELRPRLALVAVNIATGRARTLRDLGPSPPVNNQIRGLSVSADGSRILTSTVNLRGDIWLISGLRWREWTSRWQWPFRRP